MCTCVCVCLCGISIPPLYLCNILLMYDSSDTVGYAKVQTIVTPNP